MLFVHWWIEPRVDHTRTSLWQEEMEMISGSEGMKGKSEDRKRTRAVGLPIADFWKISSGKVCDVLAQSDKGADWQLPWRRKKTRCDWSLWIWILSKSVMEGKCTILNQVEGKITSGDPHNWHSSMKADILILPEWTAKRKSKYCMPQRPREGRERGGKSAIFERAPRHGELEIASLNPLESNPINNSEEDHD